MQSSAKRFSYDDADRSGAAAAPRAAGTETFREALRACRGVLLAALALFLLSGAFSYVISARNAARTLFQPTGKPEDLALVSVAKADDSSTATGVVLTESAAVGDDYFADALFCGDSLSDGIRVYTEVFQGYHTCTMIGLSPTAVSYQTFVNKTGDPAQEMTMLDQILYFKPKKIYIMLGTNGLNWDGITVKALIDGYEQFLDQLIAAMPGADIVLESIPPTTQQTAQERPSYVKENILAYNSAVKELAVRKGVYFLDVYASVVGPDGYLPEAIAAADGIHFQPSGYQIWKDYLKTHVIQGEASYSLGADGAMQFTRSQTAATDAAQPAATDAAQPAANGAAQPAANGAAQPAANGAAQPAA